MDNKKFLLTGRDLAYFIETLGFVFELGVDLPSAKVLEIVKSRYPSESEFVKVIEEMINMCTEKERHEMVKVFEEKMGLPSFFISLLNCYYAHPTEISPQNLGKVLRHYAKTFRI